VSAALIVEDLAKTFTLHTQGGAVLPVLDGVGLTVAPGECVALGDPSGAGKSTLLRAVYGNYRVQRGRVLVRHDGAMVDIVTAEARRILDVRRRTLGYVSQFLRVIPRVPAVTVVAEPLRALGVTAEEAARRARTLLSRLRIPERLWPLSPVTFSGGEQQRVNVARGLVAELPVLLLDEPTAALDAESRATVVELIQEARGRGTAIVGAFHDRAVRDAVASRVVLLSGQAA
jgi:alpha-D-ribose 1-methylphosphonate 5-triphosphate synthase subunit PhnL